MKFNSRRTLFAANFASKTAVICLIFFVTGCATKSVDWFVKNAWDPQKFNLDTKYCVAAQPQTVDGTTPDAGPILLSCGDSLVGLKQWIIKDCEKQLKSKCMATWYFERNKDEFVQSFEAENMAGIRLQADKFEKERIANICENYGFKRRTPDHASCVMQQSQFETSEKKLQQISNQIDWQRRINLMNQAAEQLKNNGQQSSSKTCTPQPDGTLRCK